MPKGKPHPYNEAGRRMKAGLISYLVGYKGVDRTLREMPEEVGEGWAELAGKLLLVLQGQVVDSLIEVLQKLSVTCHELGSEGQSFALRRLFWNPTEAYQNWDCSLTAQSQVPPELAAPFERGQELRDALKKVIQMRYDLLCRMIACQEEMDWIVYGMCGRLSATHPAVQGQSIPEGIESHQRPFRIWQRASGDYERAVEMIPAQWSIKRQALWQARLSAIHDNETLRRLENANYKRRWDEQWKLGNEWRDGEIAYAAEFIDAFEWWLSEKAEWWLEKQRGGGPVDLMEWAHSLWGDTRVQAAWSVATQQYAVLELDKARRKAEQKGDPAPMARGRVADANVFTNVFRRIVGESTVPAGCPFGIAYGELERKAKKAVPAQLKKLRGKLNVPRERFHSVAGGQYKWAGLQFRNRENH